MSGLTKQEILDALGQQTPGQIPGVNAQFDARRLDSMAMRIGGSTNCTVWIDGTNGDDFTGSGTEENPFKTIDGAYLGVGFGNAGAGLLEFRFKAGVAEANLKYKTRLLCSDGGGALIANTRFVGPEMKVVQADLAILDYDAAGDGGGVLELDVEADLDDPDGLALAGHFIRIKRGGSKLYFELPALECQGAYVKIPVSDLDLAEGDVVDIVKPAVTICGYDEGGGYALIRVTGESCAIPVFGHGFARLAFDGLLVLARGVSFDRCVINTSEELLVQVFEGASTGFANCAVVAPDGEQGSIAWNGKLLSVDGSIAVDADDAATMEEGPCGLAMLRCRLKCEGPASYFSTGDSYYLAAAGVVKVNEGIVNAQYGARVRLNGSCPGKNDAGSGDSYGYGYWAARGGQIVINESKTYFKGRSDRDVAVQAAGDPVSVATLAENEDATQRRLGTDDGTAITTSNFSPAVVGGSEGGGSSSALSVKAKSSSSDYCKSQGNPILQVTLTITGTNKITLSGAFWNEKNFADGCAIGLKNTMDGANSGWYGKITEYTGAEATVETDTFGPLTNEVGKTYDIQPIVNLAAPEFLSADDQVLDTDNPDLNKQGIATVSESGAWEVVKPDAGAVITVGYGESGVPKHWFVNVYDNDAHPEWDYLVPGSSLGIIPTVFDTPLNGNGVGGAPNSFLLLEGVASNKLISVIVEVEIRGGTYRARWTLKGLFQSDGGTLTELGQTREHIGNGTDDTDYKIRLRADDGGKKIWMDVYTEAVTSGQAEGYHTIVQ